jgi:NAD(P)-dependent dehydrogenase (short-subunit alcohol dehydrogenase family)
MNSFDLRGHVAVITGGRGGIGQAIAERMRRSGANVALWDLADVGTPVAAEDAATTTTFTVDVTDEGSVGHGMADTVARFGRIDILVTAAGILGETLPVADYPVKSWQRIVDVNLTGVFMCCRAALPYMVRANYGRIVNLSSIAGKEGNPFQSAYSAAKAGVIALTKSIAKEVADTGIRVNCVTPAVIATDLVHQMSQETLKSVLSKIPLGRPGRPEEVATMVAWLASQECSFSTGAVFDLSGGRATY